MRLEILLLVLLSCVLRTVGSEDAVAGDTSCSGPISVSEYNVLQEFYVATHGAGWYDSLGWTFENDPSTRALSLPCSLPWYGISCITASSGNCSLSQLKLDNNNLIGILPTSLFSLENMADLLLEMNSLSGSLPTEIGQWSQLYSMSLQSNSLTGDLPSQMGLLVHCNNFDVGSNLLQGTIPTEIGTMSALSELILGVSSTQSVFSVSGNMITGQIPSELAKLTQLNYLDLGAMHLSGTVSSSLGLLTQLIDLEVNQNLLSGCLPSELAEIETLALLLVEENYLTGPLFSEIGVLRLLTSLMLRKNMLSNTIPSQVGLLSRLGSLALDFNLFNGSIAEELWDLTALEELYLGSNALTGTLSSSIHLVSGLVSLDLSINSLSGQMPSQLGLLVVLNDLNFAENMFTGTIPYELSKMQVLIEIELASNRLTGQIPRDLLSMMFLTEVILRENYLTGYLPDVLSPYLILEALVLNDNMLSGPIPSILATSSNLYELVLSANLLSGAIPPLPQYALIALVLSNNTFEGPFPTSLFSNRSNCLLLLDLSNNSLSGPLPADLFEEMTCASLPADETYYGMKDMFLSSNYFTGQLSFNDTGRTLQALDLSSNFFSGRIPRNLGNLSTFVVSSNLLSGSLDLTSSSVLTELVLASNQLVGNVTGLSRFGNLTLLSIENNSFTGSIDALFDYTSAKFEELLLFNNAFSGSLPSGLAKITSLKALLVQQNSFTGNPASSFNVSAQRLLTAVDLSNNDFSGPIPAIIFQLPLIESVGMTKTCFSGSLPSVLCECTTLKVLLMDGVTSGEACQRRFDFTATSDAYVSRKGPLQGGIPACLWSLPLLTSVHLSSNGLTGSLAGLDDMTLSANLSSLVLSYNQLSGTIPQALQNANFTTLQLSNNRFKGTYTGQLLVADAVVDLENNRLSGFLPESFQFAQQVNVLSGNLFDCNARHPKPQYDPNRDVVACGSAQLNDSLVLWAVAVCIGCVLFATALCQCIRRDNVRAFVRSSAMVMRSYFDFVREHTLFTPASYEDLTLLQTFQGISDASLRGYLNTLFLAAGFALIAALLLCVCACVPIYIALKMSDGESYSTHTYQYGWLVSSLFLSGIPPAVVVILLWLVMVILLVQLLVRPLETTLVPVASSEAKEVITVDSHSPEAEEMRASANRNHSKWSLLTMSGSVLVVHTGIMIGLNVLYLYVDLSNSYSVTTKAAVQVFTALAKLVWDDTIIPQTLRNIRAFRGNDRRAFSPSVAVLKFVLGSVGLVAVPFIISLVANSLCFLDLFIPETYVTETFIYNLASQTTCVTVTVPPVKLTKIELNNDDFNIDDERLGTFQPPATITDCIRYGAAQQETSEFYPPFTYSFQCGSGFLTTYIPVMMYIYAFRTALLLLSILLWHWRRETFARAVGSRDSWWVSVVAWVNKGYWAPVRILTASEDGDVPRHHVGDDLLRTSTRLCLQLQCVLVLLTYGLASPPLAAAVVLYSVLDLCNHVYFVDNYLHPQTSSSDSLSGKLLDPAVEVVEYNAATLDQLIAGLSDACRGAAGTVRRCVWIGVHISSVFWALMVFDMVGDTNVHHPVLAAWISGSVVMLPVAVRLGLWIWSSHLAPASRPSTQITSQEPADNSKDMMRSSTTSFRTISLASVSTQSPFSNVVYPAKEMNEDL
jgi:hypothetical protein